MVSRARALRGRYERFITQRMGEAVEIVVGKAVVKTIRGALFEDPSQLMRWLPDAVTDQPVRTFVCLALPASAQEDVVAQTAVRVGGRLFTVMRVVEYRMRGELICLVAIIDP